MIKLHGERVCAQVNKWCHSMRKDPSLKFPYNGTSDMPKLIYLQQCLELRNCSISPKQWRNDSLLLEDSKCQHDSRESRLKVSQEKLKLQLKELKQQQKDVEKA